MLAETAREWKKYYENVEHYACKIKEAVKARDAEARVILFGSVVKGGMKPDSDVDVLVITRLAESVEERLRLRVEIARSIGVSTPFEIHIVTPKEYAEWYEKRIGKHVEL